MRRLGFAVLAALGLAVASPQARATFQTIGPGGATSGSIAGTYSGATFVSSETDTLSSGALKIKVVEDVFKRGSTYDFLYQVTNLSTNGRAVKSFAVVDYTGFTTTVGYATNNPDTVHFVTGTVTAADATRSSAGDSVKFDFAAGGIGVGATSNVLVIETNGTAFDNFGSGTALFAPGGSVAGGPLFEPAVTPEPSALSLLGLGGLGLVSAGAFYRRRLRIHPSMA
jgi:hypothetical protein